MTARMRTEKELGPEPPLGPEAWSEFLSRELGLRVEVVFTRARRTVLKLVPRGKERTVRMNGFFAHAPADVRDAVVAWIRSGKRARRKLALLDAWVETQIEHVERTEPRRVHTRTQGRVHDLERLAAELRAAEFEPEFAADRAKWPRLTWGRAPRTGRRRTLRLGSFDVWSCVVRLHPVLDQPLVPESFVRYVLFHELLHAALPAERASGGRRIFHSAEFRRREREYSGTKAALVWEKAHLSELLWSARTGTDMRPSHFLTRKLAARDLKQDATPVTAPAAPEAPRGIVHAVQRWLFD